MSETKKRFHVVSPVERKGGKTSWVRLGVAYPNRDSSINLYLDALPTNQRMQLRDADEDEKSERSGARRQGSEPDAVTPSLPQVRRAERASSASEAEALHS